MKIEEISDESDGRVQPPEGPEFDLLTQAMQHFGGDLPRDKDGVQPPLPPGMAAMRGKSADEILAELNKTPLFMTELEENDDLEAFKALAYEGTPLEVATNFKEQGNDCFSSKKWKDAKEFYTKGIQVLGLEDRKRKGLPLPPSDSPIAKEPPSRDPEEIKKEQKLWETCLVNRAACHLELANFRSATQDCAAALRLNPENIKAYYRSARALLKLSKIAEADDACAHGLSIAPDNAALKSVASAIIAKSEQVQAKARKEAERLQRQQREQVMLRTALKARNIKTRKTAQPPEMEDAKVALVPDPLSPESTLTFPTVLLYPVHLESDFIKAYNETQSLGEHLEYMFPLPWDSAGEYTVTGVEAYMETVKGGLVKVGRKVPLLKVLSEADVEVVDEVVRIFVVPKGKAEAWVKEFKMKKAAEKGSST